MQKIPSTVFVIFGATGDLAYRKLVPALYNLNIDGLLPTNFAVIGIGRESAMEHELLAKYQDGITKFSRNKFQRKYFSFIEKTFDYMSGDIMEAGTYAECEQKIQAYITKWGTETKVVIYLAVASRFFDTIIQNFKPYEFVRNKNQSSFVIEKPFGHDLESARKLNQTIKGVLAEKQIYRIDHYLGKETVQNILAFRFANALFEAVWNKNFIEWVEISSLESVGVEDRGGYYDSSGALRDMIQNHMLQLLCMVAMEPPISYKADDVRDKKVEVLKSVRPIPSNKVPECAVRGQYKGGSLDDVKYKPYRKEKGVNPNSQTETYAALELYIDNWRWEGVPFYIRSGKSLAIKSTVIVVKLKAAPKFSFPSSATKHWESNMLIIHINPSLDINFCFQAKVPGQEFKLDHVDMVFNFEKELSAHTPEAYEHLIFDVLESDQTLFMRSDQVEEAWKVIMPILNYWAKNPATDFPNYSPGSLGPKAAEILVKRNGDEWYNPIQHEGA